MKWRIVFAAGLALSGLAVIPALAQTQPRTAKAALPSAAEAGDMNSRTVGLAGGLLEGTFIRYAADIAKVLDDEEKLRVLPIVTYGAVGNVTDLLYLKGVDVAITQADVLDYFKRELKTPGIENRIHYISPLFHAEVHVYAREEFKALKDLEGRKVAFNTPGSAANLTGQIVFNRLNIKVEPLFINNAIALEKMRTGEIAAVVHVVAKPNDLFAKFKPEPGFHFLPVDFTSEFMDFYLPTNLSSDDYPNLIPPDSPPVQTIAVPTVLAVFNWPTNSDRYRRVARFVEAFFTKFDQLRNPPYQPKWKEVNIAGKVPGWTRFRASEDILAKLAAADGQPQDTKQMRDKFEKFLTAQGVSRGNRPLTDREREALFNQFMEWQRR